MVTDSQVRRLFKLAKAGNTLSSAAVGAGMSKKTARKYLIFRQLPSKMKSKRQWRTRKDPFKGVWSEVEEILASNPKLTALELLANLQERHPDRFSASQVRTLQRRLQTQYRQTPSTEEEFIWMQKLLQGAINFTDLEEQLQGKIDSKDLQSLNHYILSKPLRYRNRAVVIFSYIHGIPKNVIARFLLLEPRTVNSYIQLYEVGGVAKLMDLSKKDVKKFEDQKFKDALFAILHAPPSSYGINRTTWRMVDLHRIMAEKGFPIAQSNIRRIIRDAGYTFQKAKVVLTSNDPDYQKKLREITNILSHLGPKEKFFSIDEFGPFTVKLQGGNSLAPKGQPRTIPQYQKSKGSLIVTGALELSTNQITHFFSEKKNTDEMIKLLEILLEKYSNEEYIYFSWDAASWHGSKRFYKKVDEFNSPEYRNKHKIPFIKLAPLPACAQFLNVIESIFSGMARAIIHNSDYQSVEDCKQAIDCYFIERNEHFKIYPKRAGNKIWGKELIPVEFSESNNCKDPRWR